MKYVTFLASIAVGVVCLAQEEKVPVQITNPGERFDLIGDLGVKLGEMATVEGTIVEGPMKGFEGGPYLVVKSIDGKATQKFVRIHIRSYFGEFGKASFGGKALPLVENGSTYRFRVYETGQFVGVSTEAYREAGILIQIPRFYFSNTLVAVSENKIDPIEWHPNQFVGRNALLAGVAKNESDVAIIQSRGWKLVLANVDKWSSKQLGKRAEVYGTIRATESRDIFRAENCRPRLINLEDQLGQTVALRGTARSMNGHWWLNYRGTDLYVEGMEELPNWSADNWSPIEITGVLEQAELPRIGQISVETNPDLKTQYIVKRPKWTPVKDLLTPERPLTPE